MSWIAILIIFLATISIIFSLRLSDRPKMSLSAVVSFVKNYHSFWPIAVGACILLTIMASLYSAIGFLAGVLIFIIALFAELHINSDKTNAALFNLFAASFSVLGISIMRLTTPAVLPTVSLFAGALIVAWYKKIEFADSAMLRSILITCVGAIGANYFYAGSDLAAQFLLLLIVLGCTGMLISIFAATNYGQSKPKQMFAVAAISYAIIATATAAWVIPFRPINIAVCIILGAIATYICVRFDKPWIKLSVLIATILASYFIAEFYGAIVALISLSALIPSASLLPNFKTHAATVADFVFILLIPIFIHSISTAGRSILFEIGNPFLLSGILLSLLFVWGYKTFLSHPSYSEKRSWIILLAPFLVGLISVILFKENSGVILLAGVFIGLVLREILLSNSESEAQPHKILTLLFFVASFLFTNFLFS